MNEQTEYPYDVFISYSHADEEWVTDMLLPRLEGAGLRVCIDYRDFVAGKPALVNMQDAAKNSRHTVLVLTPAWVESEWTFYESLLTRTSDPAGLQRRTVPLRLQPWELPGFISMLTWVDFTRPDRLDIAWTQLLTAVGALPVQEAPEEPTRAEWCLKHPYPMPPNFTGRAAERQMLTQWLKADMDHPLLVLRALGGFGKSALGWHWLLYDVDPARWPRVVWWSFYDEPIFDIFLRETLAYLGVDPRGLGPRQQIDTLLRLLHYPGVLLILDGFERALRAYSGMGAAYQGDLPLPRPGLGEGGGWGEGEGQRDCVSPIAEHFLRSLCCLPGMRGKVLMTTRLRPRALETHGGDLLQGCREEELTQMQPADAVAFFRAQGVRGSRAEIERACQPYGYHPLSLRLLAGLVARDLQQPGDMAAARRLDVSGDLVARRHHVLAQAYDNLTPARQNLLSRIACFRGAVTYDALRAVQTSEVSETSEVSLDADLRDLVASGLLHHDRQTNRYDLHPIVRRYAYDRLDGPEREAAHGQLRDYFAAVPPPERVQRLEDLAPVIELYHHTVRAGQHEEALRLYSDRLQRAIYYQFGAYQLQIELLRALFPDGENQPPRLKTKRAQSWTANDLAMSYSLSGQPLRAVPLFKMSAEVDESQRDKVNLAADLGNLAQQQMAVGALQAAQANLHRQIGLGQEGEDERNKAVGHVELGRLLAYQGLWEKAERELAALVIVEKEKQINWQGITWAYRALRALLLARWTAITPNPQPPISSTPDALIAARQALKLADEYARTHYPLERDYVRAHWLLGAAHRANGDMEDADRHLSEALTRCRSINMVDHEADILLDLARLRAATGARAEALRLAQEALTITERSGYVLQGADVHLFLAQMALDDGEKGTALEHAREARRLATCDGPPDYTYKVAYDEAGALLQQMESG
jgi:tetratricopeptide (TPR) repeat protein